MSSRGGRRAGLPEAQWQPPERLLADSGGTAVRFIEETGGKAKVFDFSQFPVALGMQCWLARVFADRIGPRSALRRVKTAEQIFIVLRLFARTLADAAEPVRRPQDLAAAHVAAFRMRYAGIRSGWSYLESLRSTLRDSPELPAVVRVALLSGQRPEHGRDEPEGLVPYTADELQAIMTMLRRDVRLARERIQAGHELLARYRAGQVDLAADDERVGYLLDSFDRTGDFPRYPNGFRLAEVSKAGGVGHLGSLLCLSLDEMTAFALLLTALTGENFGTIAAWPAAHHRPDGNRDDMDRVALVEQVKPRRGPEREHMVVAVEDLDELPAGLREVLSVEEDERRLFRSPLRIYRLLLELTEVSRRLGGHASAFSAFTRHPGRLGTSHWVEGVGAHHVRRWARDRGFPVAEADDGTGLPAVNVRRLRQTAIEQRRRPVSHTRQTMNDHYLMRSRTVAEDSRRVVGAALRAEVGKARVVQAMPVFTPDLLARAQDDLDGVAAETGLAPQRLTRLLSGEQDTPLASCTDHLAGPRSEPGQPCTASFLSCLDCENARALPHQLPMQIAAADRIAGLRTNLDPTLWRARYEPRLRQLNDILSAYTAAERERARGQISDRHLRMLGDLLDGKWDLR